MNASVVRLVGLFAVVAAVSAPASAFQETAVNPAQGASVAAKGESVDLGGSGVNLDAAPAKSGTVLSIPGIGAIGRLPKLDFGLELLYADDDPATPDNDSSSSDDVLVRGAIKHKF